MAGVVAIERRGRPGAVCPQNQVQHVRLLVAIVANCNQTAATSQTPGFLHVAVNGVEVNTAEFWDYSGGGSSFDIEPDIPTGPHLRAGEVVTITITPQYVTGAWEFAVPPGEQE
jgi:hypothetical protein